MHYFVGNSLGLQPRATEHYVNEELKIWQRYGVEGHFHKDVQRPWVRTDDFVTNAMANVKPAFISHVNALTLCAHSLQLTLVTRSSAHAQRKSL